MSNESNMYGEPLCRGCKSVDASYVGGDDDARTCEVCGLPQGTDFPESGPCLVLSETSEFSDTPTVRRLMPSMVAEAIAWCHEPVQPFVTRFVLERTASGVAIGLASSGGSPVRARVPDGARIAALGPRGQEFAERLRCSACDRAQKDVPMLVGLAADGTYLCSGCVSLAAEIIERAKPAAPLASDYDVIVAMLARMEAAEDGRKCPDEPCSPKEWPEDRFDPQTVDVAGGRVLLVPGGYTGFYSRLRFDEDGRLVGWGSYE